MLQLKGEGRNIAQVQEPKHIEQIFADYFLAGFCFCGIQFRVTRENQRNSRKLDPTKINCATLYSKPRYSTENN